MNPRKTGKPGPYGHPTKTGKIGRGTLVEPQHDLEKPENHDPNGFLRKPKKKDPAPQWSPKTGKAGPNVILEKLNDCKQKFICVLAERRQNLENKT